MTTDSDKNIILISNGIITPGYLQGVKDVVFQKFRLPVTIMENQGEISPFFDAYRKQYNANELLKETATLAPANALKTIGLFRVDLFIPILTYIFGQAIFQGPTAVASLHRLKNEFYGLKKDDALVLERFKKVVVHELGHAFGLKHCHQYGCVMNSSTYVEELDQKSIDFCRKCAMELELPPMPKKS